MGSVANYILYQLIEKQLVPKIEGLSVNFDEIGLECNELISFESLKIPHTIEQFKEWITSYLPLLKSGFSWNSWMYWLPEDYQRKEVVSHFYDLRVLKHFKKYANSISN